MKDRLVSIDLLRGLTVAVMIIVNNPGSWAYIYAPLSHSDWNGCTPTDMVFPFFLFIVGLSVHFSLSKAKSKNSDRSAILSKILKRGFVLFGLGLFLNAFPFFEFNHLRIMGVLQRISIVFMVSAILYLYFSTGKLYLITGFLLLFYWVLMCFIPVPSVGISNLEPASNMAAWLDGLLLKGHMWEHTKTWDPEGLTSTIPAISSGLIGVLSGIWLSSKSDSSKKLILLILFGFVLILLGYVWSIFFPINKSLWTSSFVLFTSGFAIIILVAFYYLFDIKKVNIQLGLVLAFGSNAIVAYLFSELLAKIANTFPISPSSPERIFIQPEIFDYLLKMKWSPFNASLAMAIIWLAICSIPIWLLFKKKIIIKV